MSFETNLTRAIKKADVDGVVELLVAADEKTRRAAFDSLRRLFTASPYGGPQRDACQVALLGCGTVRDVKGLVGTEMVTPRAAAVIAVRPQRIADGIIRAGLEGQWSTWLWPAIHSMVKEGTIDEPDHEGYLIGLLWSASSRELMGLEWVKGRPERATAEHTANRIRREPDLVDLVFRALLIDEGPAIWASGLWFEALPLLVASGDLDRDRTLDEALGGYLADLRPTSARRFGGLWKALEPSVDEVRARRATLVKMASSHDPGAQKMALAELTKLVKAAGPADMVDVVDACGTPLSGTQKNLATAALRLLGRVAAAHPQEAIETALTGLGHPRSDVQEAVLDFVTAHIDEAADGQSVRADLLGWADTVAPQLRPRISAMTGLEFLAVGEEETPDLGGLAAAVADLPPALAQELSLADAVAAVRHGSMPDAAVYRPWNPAALSVSSAIAPVQSQTELVEVVAAVLSGSVDGIDVERALDGISRFAAEPPASSLATSLQTHFDSIERRLGEWGLRSPLVVTARCWVTGSPPAPLPFLERGRGRLFSKRRPGIAGNLIRPKSEYGQQFAGWAQFDGAGEAANLAGMGLARAWEVAYRCHLRDARLLLAFPSLESGWLNAADLVERLESLEAAGSIPDRFDACQAVMRLAPVASPEVVSRLRALAGPVAAAALRVLGQPTAAVSDEGLRRSTAIELDIGAPVGHVKPPADSRYAELPVITFPEASAPDKMRRDDPVGVALGALRTPPARLSWWNSSSALLAGVSRAAMTWATTMVPRLPDLFGAAVAATVVRDIDSNRTSDIEDVALAALLSADVPLGSGAHTGLAVALVARNDALGTTAVDLLSQSATDGRLDPALLGRLLGGFHESGVIALARSGPRFVAAAEGSALAAEQSRLALQSLVASLAAVPRDIHAVLDAWLAVASQVGRGVTDEAARKYLENLVASSPRSKRGKLAASLLAMPREWDDLTPELLALDALIARARRWADASGSA